MGHFYGDIQIDIINVKMFGNVQLFDIILFLVFRYLNCVFYLKNK